MTAITMMPPSVAGQVRRRSRHTRVDINGRTGAPDEVAASYAVTHRADYDAAAAFGDAAEAAYLDGYTDAVHKLG